MKWRPRQFDRLPPSLSMIDVTIAARRLAYDGHEYESIVQILLELDARCRWPIGEDAIAKTVKRVCQRAA